MAEPEPETGGRATLILPWNPDELGTGEAVAITCRRAGFLGQIAVQFDPTMPSDKLLLVSNFGPHDTLAHSLDDLLPCLLRLERDFAHFSAVMQVHRPHEAEAESAKARASASAAKLRKRYATQVTDPYFLGRKYILT